MDGLLDEYAELLAASAPDLEAARAAAARLRPGHPLRGAAGRLDHRRRRASARDAVAAAGSGPGSAAGPASATRVVIRAGRRRLPVRLDAFTSTCVPAHDRLVVVPARA